MSHRYLDRCAGDELFREAQEDPGLQEATRGGLSRELIKKLQYLRLRRTLAYVAEKSSFYRKLYSEHNVAPDSLRSLEDIRRIPFTEPHHLASEPFRFACVSIGDVGRIVTISSSGTSGDAKKILFTHADLRRIAALFSADTKQVLGQRKAVVQIMLPGTTPYGQANLLGKAIEAAGSVPVVTGDDADMNTQIESISKNHCTALVGYSSYIYKLTRLNSLRAELGSMGIEAIVTAGEPLSPSVQNALESVWKADVFCHYGLTEMGFNAGMDCGQAKGYHIHEADYIAEIVDAETSVPVEEGQEGELVLTSINREAMPLVRYRTRDLTKILVEPCPCGSSLRRIGPVRRLAETTISLSGGTIETSDLDDILFSIPEIVDYRVAKSDDAKDEMLCLLIEKAPGTNLNSFVVAGAVKRGLCEKGIIIKAEKNIVVRVVPSIAPSHKRPLLSSA